MANVVVTGGTGFMGSHLADRLLAGGHKVYAIDDMSGSDGTHLDHGHGLYVEDCRNFKAIDRVFKGLKPEIVYHLAANAAEGKAQFSPVDITSRNYASFVSVLTAGLRHGMKRIVVTSSIAVYGSIPTPFREDDEPYPEDLYGLSKLTMEKTLKIMSHVHNFEYVITRPHNVYGPRQNMTDPYRNVVTIFMNHLLQEKPYAIYGDGSMQRCFSYIDDVVEVLYQCGFKPEAKNQTYNVGADRAISLQELSDTLLKITGSQVRPRYLPKRHLEVQDAIENHNKCKREFGYKDTPFEEGLQKTWEWAKKVGYQYPRPSELELSNDKVPENWKESYES